MGGGDEAGFKAAGPGLDGLLDVQGADQPVLGGAHRQLHNPHLPDHRRIIVAPRLAPLAKALPGVGGATVRTALEDGYLWQQGGQGAYRRGLGGPLLAADQHPADLGVDGVEQQGPLHRGLPDYGGEGEAGLRWLLDIIFGHWLTARPSIGFWVDRRSPGFIGGRVKPRGLRSPLEPHQR